MFFRPTLRQRLNLEEELKSLDEVKKGKGNAAAIFNLRGKVLGLKKTTQEAVVLINPENGQEVNTPEDIRKVSLDYCTSLLRNREHKDEFKDEVERKKILHDLRMKEYIDNDIEKLSEDMF